MGALTGTIGLALALTVIVGLPALFLVVICLWSRWVREHFWESFGIACALVVAVEAFVVYASCSGKTL